MIPSLNLQKLRCAPAPVLHTAITPRGNSVANSAYGGPHDSSASAASTERDSHAPALGDHEVSAIRSGAVDASAFLGCDVEHETDVPKLRAKLREAKSLLVALDAWYAARLAEKEQLMVYRLAQLTHVMDTPRAGNRSAAATTSSTNRATMAGTTTPRRPFESGTPTSQRRPVSPRLYQGGTTPTDRRRGLSPSMGRAVSEAPPSEAGSSVAGRGYSTTGRRSPTTGAAVAHPRPFGSNVNRRGSTSGAGVPYVPGTTYSPRAPLTGSGMSSSRVASTTGTPLGTPRVAPISSRTTGGHSPTDVPSHNQSFGVSPRQASLNTPLSARSVGGAPVSARRSQIQTVNWSSSIPHASSAADSQHGAHGGGVLRGGTSSGLATARVVSTSTPRSDGVSDSAERRAQTPRY
jgi:hypothetical protein